MARNTLNLTRTKRLSVMRGLVHFLFLAQSLNTEMVSFVSVEFERQILAASERSERSNFGLPATDWNKGHSSWSEVSVLVGTKSVANRISPHEMLASVLTVSESGDVKLPLCLDFISIPRRFSVNTELVSDQVVINYNNALKKKKLTPSSLMYTILPLSPLSYKGIFLIYCLTCHSLFLLIQCL